MKLTSSAFFEQQAIPRSYTGEGEDLSPALEWSETPTGPRKAENFALICEDIDAPGTSSHGSHFVHWVLYNIPAQINSLPRGIPAQDILAYPPGAVQGKNSFGNVGYGGPKPPAGHGTHHYVFTLYALDKELELEPGLTKPELTNAMRGSIITLARLTGTFERLASKAG